ncbi:RHS repeat domain-containing protein, partial [Chryseobacterium sp. MDT2-18]|uniref:RHS repeat domain-containing protein n=1 Tax=Chryseobacterium sp. MDT2-18 TaxID=1259136 RepID=UPI00278A8AED
DYDHQNRLLVHKHQVDLEPEEILTQNSYNEIGQLKNKKVGGITTNSSLQSIDYAYNIRGWMTKINDPSNMGTKLFGYKIKYNNVDGLQVPNTDFTNDKVLPKYNGNIAEIDWTTANDGILRRYGYVYDGLNRLTAGYYQNSQNPSAKEYFERLLYDSNGNITELKRSSSVLAGNPFATLIDNLTYSSTGNQLQTISDIQQNSDGYPYTATPKRITYDPNGNMTSMADKGISAINYNYLNLPVAISSSQGNTNYIYRADGVKLKKTYGTTVTAYLDGFQYENNLLQFIPTVEGYYDFIKNAYIYNYNDHLGNVRLSYYKNSAGVLTIDTESNYYPFGLEHTDYNNLVGNSKYNYKYNGKELQETGMYAMDWRNYMPDIGRFATQDPLSALIPTLTPYRFAFNNPVYFSDPTGLLEESNGLATCPTCPKTPEFQPYIDDPKNMYVYVPETKTAEKEVQIEEVVVTGKKSESNTTTYLGQLNGVIGTTGDWLTKNNKGGTVGVWTTPIKNRNFDGITYNKLNVRYYGNNWQGNQYVKVSGVGKFLKNGSVVGSVVLGAIEVGDGVATDYNDYQTKGETNGRNTAVAAGSAAGGVVGGWAGAEAGATVGAAIGVWFGGAGAVPGALIGGLIGGALGSWGGSNLGSSGVENVYENTK